MSELFGQRTTAAAIEQGSDFSPQFDRDGLIPAIVQDAASGEVLMFAYMNKLALEKTITTGIATYWSRSRGKLWVKGETSGETQKVCEIRTDCDQDAILLKVTPQGRGSACHTGKRACFYRNLDLSDTSQRPLQLEDTGGERLFDPKKVYSDN